MSFSVGLLVTGGCDDLLLRQAHIMQQGTSASSSQASACSSMTVWMLQRHR